MSDTYEWKPAAYVLNLDDTEEWAPSPGFCIYCGRRPPEVSLTDEHVIPAGLGGRLVIDDASCTECQEKINPFETEVIKRFYGVTRDFAGVNSGRRRGKRYPRSKEYRVYEGQLEPTWSPEHGFLTDAPRFDGELKDFLSSSFTFEETTPVEPGIILGRDLDDWSEIAFKHQAVPTPDKQPHNFTITTILTLGSMLRLMLKIAHSFLVFQRGADAFKPLFWDLIPQQGWNYGHYVGSNKLFAPQSGLHRLSVFDGFFPLRNREELTVCRCLLVDIRLFAQFIGPIYTVVAGLPFDGARQQFWMPQKPVYRGAVEQLRRDAQSVPDVLQVWI